MLNSTPALPILYFTFANDYRSDGTYLKELGAEERHIIAALKKAEEEGLCEVVIRNKVRIEDVIDFFQEHGSRIVLFHYAGHAEARGLRLETTSGESTEASKEGLILLLSRHPDLACVFLNGCCTAQQSRALQEAGIPFVIGTTTEIDDQAARQLSTRFYKGIGLGKSLKNAWSYAQTELLVRYGNNQRSLFRKSVVRERHPWEQLTKAGAESIEDWNLPALTKNYLFALPKLPASYAPPENPYRFLERYQEQDAAIFFGRNKYIHQLYHQVADPTSAPVLLLTGQSGVGKSSLLEAGLVPRLRSSRSVRPERYQAQQTLVQCLLQAINYTGATDDLQAIQSHWLSESAEKPLVIILDQLEVVFRKSAEIRAQELKAFLALITNLFNRQLQDSSTPSSLILSYRKEYDAEWQAALSRAQIRREKVFIEPLDRTDIAEIVNGLRSTAQLRNQYKLKVQEELIPVLSNDLLQSTHSPIAPTLQIILTKLWDTSLQKDRTSRIFTLNNYNQLKKEGIELQDFLDTQMSALDTWSATHNNDATSSGLALDLLYFFTTAQRTAQTRTLQEVEQRYPHRIDILQATLDALEELSLIRAAASTDSQRVYILAHDTLAPVVQREYERSSAIGQQARRLLIAKTEVFKTNPESILNAEDLLLAENGLNGMRSWTAVEQQLIENSRVDRAKVLAAARQRKIIAVTGLGLIIAFAILAGIFWQQSSLSARTNALVAQALQLAKTNATEAFVLIRKALALKPHDESAMQAYYDIYSENEFYYAKWQLEDEVKDIALSSQENFVVAVGNTAQFCDSSGSTCWETQRDEEVSCVAISPDGASILIAETDGKMTLFDSTGQSKHQLPTQDSWVRSALFLPDSKQILFGNREGKIKLWDITNEQLQVFPGHTNEIHSLAYAPASRRFVSACWKGPVKLWSLDDGFIIDLPTDGRGLAVDLSADGEQIIIGDRIGLLYFYNYEGELQAKVQAHDSRINAVKIIPDDSLILTAGDDNTIKLWNQKGQLLKTYRGHSEYVYDLAVSLDGQRFYSASKDHTVKAWQIDSKVKQVFGVHENEVSDLAISEDGTLLVSATGSGKQSIASRISNPGIEFFEAFDALPEPQHAYIWHLEDESGNPDTLSGHRGGVTAVAISQKAGLILTGSEDFTAMFWDLKGQPTGTVIAHTHQVRDVAFSKDGLWYATAGYDQLVILGSTNDLSDTIHLHLPANAEAIDFSYDNQYLAVGLTNSDAILFDLAGKEIRQFTDNQFAITNLTFSPDGSRLLVGDANGEVHLYNLQGENLESFKIEGQTSSGAEAITAIALSPSGDLAFIGSIGGFVEVFEVASARRVWRESGLSTDIVYSLALTANSMFIGKGRRIKEVSLK